MTFPNALSLIEISSRSERWEEDPLFSQNDISDALKLAREKFPLFTEKGHVDIILGDNALLKELNATYLGKDNPTNVLSFPQEKLEKGTQLPSGDWILLGDIILSYETIKEEARVQDKPFSHHLKHLVVHGFLHLLGFDHEDEKEAQEMESLEIEILKSLSIPNPYKKD